MAIDAIEPTKMDFPIPTSPTASQSPPTPLPSPKSKGRRVVMCFDGTGYEPGKGNSNVVRFFRALEEGPEQITYYQPGVGTYSKHTGIVGKISTTLDSAIAWHLDDHVKDGYTYLVQNYQVGDKVCIFGFSRGAHTARVLAGMIYKVGIVRKDNFQQIDFAYNIYMTTGSHGHNISREFKTTFATPAYVDFLGIWDTVSSVGLISQSHPFTSVNYGVKCVRHALALDEHRAKFRADMWCEPALGRGHELDIDLPIPERKEQEAISEHWEYEPPGRDYADVKEVWFAGAHADVGGDSKQHNMSLQLIPLRWMIKECLLAMTQIQFDVDYLRFSLNFDFRDFAQEMKTKNITFENLGANGRDFRRYDSVAKTSKLDRTEIAPEANTLVQGIHDVFDRVFDPLNSGIWWILEFIPFLTTRQDSQGNWIRKRICNFGRGRHIPFYKGKVLVHQSVEAKIGDKKRPYHPIASNWDEVVDSDMVSYIS
ncbi:hypothetical protein AX14_003639 [Amanita brunnescens Koide BX004]|nr:hypothetical protein AX14_003639 [Amanita brunnescens Koide BX004]